MVQTVRHTTCHNSITKEIMQGTVKGGRKWGRTRKMWLDNIKDWTDMLLTDHEAMGS